MNQSVLMKGVHRLCALTAAASILAAASIMPAFAQSGTPAPQADDDTCVARPEQDPQLQRPDVQGRTAQKLANCGSVLTPPAVGDPEIVEPAPPVGETPVIKPRELPPAQAPQTR